MQQPNCYPCSKPNVKRITCNKSNVIYEIKHISFFCPHESQPPFFFVNSPKLLTFFVLFLFCKRAFIFLSYQSQPLLFLLDHFYPPLLCLISANLVTFGSCISTATCSISECSYDSVNT